VVESKSRGGPQATPASRARDAEAAIARIRDEHLALASVLYGLRHCTSRIRGGAAPDFRLLFALIDYIRLFPERLHHPKEDEHLFPALAQRCDAVRPLIAELEAEHVHGNRLIAELDAALGRYAREGAAHFDAFATAVAEYAAFHWRHMGREEDVLLPLAARHLTADDWARIATAFRAHAHPLSGLDPKAHAEALYRRILELVPSRTSARLPSAAR
jgi:hemerythrin-like domain-containing protein